MAPDHPYGTNANAVAATRYFPDVSFPARREELVVAAIRHGAPLDLVQALRELPKEWYMEPTELPELPGMDLDARHGAPESLYQPPRGPKG